MTTDHIPDRGPKLGQPIRVVSWSIGRRQACVDQLIEMGADVALLQEATVNIWRRLQRAGDPIQAPLTSPGSRGEKATTHAGRSSRSFPTVSRAIGWSTVFPEVRPKTTSSWPVESASPPPPASLRRPTPAALRPFPCSAGGPNRTAAPGGAEINMLTLPLIGSSRTSRL